MIITANELLNFLTKAQKVSPSGITFLQNDEGYKITMYCDWHDDNDFHHHSIFITNEGESTEGESTWEKGDYDFHTMNHILDEKLEGQKQKEIKAQKRKELISRMSDEEKELLGLK